MNIIERKPTRYKYKITLVRDGIIYDVLYSHKGAAICGKVSDCMMITTLEQLNDIYDGVLRSLLSRGYKEDDIVVEKIPYCTINRFNEV
jgi:hypothetical protein